MVYVGNEHGSYVIKKKGKIFEQRVLEVSKQVRFVLLTLSKCSFKTHVYSLRYNEIYHYATMQKIQSVVAQFHRKYKRYVAMQTIPHVVDYLYSLALRDDAENSVRSCSVS